MDFESSESSEKGRIWQFLVGMLLWLRIRKVLSSSCTIIITQAKVRLLTKRCCIIASWWFDTESLTFPFFYFV